MPECRLLGFGLQAFTKYQEGVVTFCERVAEVSAGTSAVVTIMNFTVTEMNHEVLAVNHLQSENLGGCAWRGCQK